MPDSFVVGPLSDALISGEATPELLLHRCSRTLGKSWKWLRPLIQRYLEKFGTNRRPRRRDVVQFLRDDRGFQRAESKYAAELSAHEFRTEPHQMFLSDAIAGLDIPAIEAVGDLAKWLGVSVGELRWFADLKALGYKRPGQQLRHYHYRLLTKRGGGIRLIEAPKPRLKDLQQQILRWILDRIPPHPAVHGFVRGRSIKTFVALHIGQQVVLRMDLQDFFPTFGGVRIQNLFRTLGYPEAVADLLGGICTNATPAGVWTELPENVDPAPASELRRLYSRPHLPQGVPTSPALANIGCYRMDCRLSALAKSADANYTRYADDLAFSGAEGFERGSERFAANVGAVLREEGFRVAHRKTRIMRQGVRQHLVGLVMNRRINVTRQDFDRLKAILHNCVRLGAHSQNRDTLPHFRAHLEGRVGFVETVNPEKGKRLRSLLERIQWEG